MACSYPGCTNDAPKRRPWPNETSLCTVHQGKTKAEYMKNYMFARRHQVKEFREATNHSAAMSNWERRTTLKSQVLTAAGKTKCDECDESTRIILRLYNLRFKALTESMMKRYIEAPHKAKLNVVVLCPNCVMRRKKVNPDGRVQRYRAKMLAGAQCCRCGEKDQRVLLQLKQELTVECANCYSIGLHM